LVENVTAFVLGGHGDTIMPLPRFSTCAGIPIPELLSTDQIDVIVKRTANGGRGDRYIAEDWFSLLRTFRGSRRDDRINFERQEKAFPCAACFEGEYCINRLYVGVLFKLGGRGLEQIIEINLLAEERIALQKSAAAVQDLIDVLGI
jgi:malate dehydrogenase